MQRVEFLIYDLLPFDSVQGLVSREGHKSMEIIVEFQFHFFPELSKTAHLHNFLRQNPENNGKM